MARVVVRSRKNASKNPNTPDLSEVTNEEVMASEMLADPIRTLHAYPVSDCAVGMILAAEEFVKKLTNTPVWITGVGNCMDSFFMGDRDLTSNFALKKAAAAAYKRAGISDPKSAFDVVEVSDQYAYQQPMWVEGLGICEEGKGGQWIDADGPDKDRVNLSGGMLAGNPLLLGGMVRAAEAVRQLKGDAGDQQVADAKNALAHGVMGPAGQFHSVVTLARD
jgi:acetyl-CoA C-acetyltransferase